MIDNPRISVCRRARGGGSVGVFANGFVCVKDFEDYPPGGESEAVRKAREWIAEKTTQEPEVVYPVITSACWSIRIGKKR